MIFDPRLYLVTDRELSLGRPLRRIVEESVRGGATLVQLREKDTGGGDFLALAKELKALLNPLGIPLIINDRLDIALLSDADGLHIGQGDIPYTEARKWLGRKKIIGLSVESIKQAREAEKLDVDYLGISPVFVTPTKDELTESLGLEKTREIASFSRHILVGIGGIHLSNVREVMETGIHGVAVVSGLCSADDPLLSARRYREEIAKAGNV